MTITVYKSTDASAPVLTGQAGALVGVLDACLVNGYGAKAAAGWGTAFTGTNKRDYRPASGNRLYLDVDDTGTTSARLVGYEAMTALATGTGPFPTAVQVSGGLFVGKSTTADATARPWCVIASATFVYVLTYCGQTVLGNVASTDNGCAFGDLLSYKSGDAYATLLMGSVTFAPGSTLVLGTLSTTGTFAQPGHYLPRVYTQLGTSIQVGKMRAMWGAGSNSAAMGNDTNCPAFPDPITGGMNFAEAYIEENASALIGRRAKVPGLYELLLNPTSLAVAYNNLDTIAGTGVYAGITYMLLKTWAGTNPAYAALQISGTWT